MVKKLEIRSCLSLCMFKRYHKYILNDKKKITIMEFFLYYSLQKNYMVYKTLEKYIPVARCNGRQAPSTSLNVTAVFSRTHTLSFKIKNPLFVN